MDNYSEEDFQIADRIIQGMFRDMYNVPVEEYIPIADIEQNAETFKRDLDFLSSINVRVPAAYIGGTVEELVPISLQHYLNGLGLDLLAPNLPRYSPFWLEYRYIISDVLRDNSRKSQNTLSYESAQETFERLAKIFLANRIATINEYRESGEGMSAYSTLNVLQRKDMPRVSTPGCNFKVITNSIGLRVFWSGAYVISPNYFGSPTSPATCVLQSGTYIFGVDGGAYSDKIQWDENAVVTLPGEPSVHLNF